MFIADLLASISRLKRQCRAPLRGVLAAIGMVLMCNLCALAPVAAADPAPANDGAQVLQSFEKAAPAPVTADPADQTRRWVMFFLGAPLLLLLLITGGLGIAMGVYGKPVFLAHTVFAGLSITLAIVHAIVGIVWFRPF
jgi:hypothetical protein